MRFAACGLFILLASCASLSKLGSVVESTAYPAGGAALGAAAGPLGAAAGAGVGHLIGELATQEETVVVDGETFQRVFVKQTAAEFILDNLLWIVGIIYLLHRCPWLPGWLWEKFKSRKKKDEDPPPSGTGGAYAGPGDTVP